MEKEEEHDNDDEHEEEEEAQEKELEDEEMTKHIRISRITKSLHFSKRNIRIPKRTTTTGASCVGSSETSRTQHAFFRRLVVSPCARMCCHGTSRQSFLE